MSEERTARMIAVAGSAVFLVLAPGTIAAYVPWAMTRWQMQPPFFGLGPLRIAGAAILAMGSIGLLDSFRRFAVEGLGTPAPVFPTKTLVVSGLYRFVRNPMYCGVTASIGGQALLFGSSTLIVYGCVVWLAFHVFILGYEEPRLLATYGQQYDEYRRNVPRWFPRLTPWRRPRVDPAIAAKR
jgi:protein-S-isoprenylcysteine O-methyltransferase Ste14